MLGRKKNLAAVKLPRNYQAKIKIYRDSADDYRWRLLGSNGRIIADSAEGYISKRNCELAVERFKALASEAAVVEVSEMLDQI